MLDNNKLTININRFLDLKVLEIKFIFVKNLYKNKEMKQKSSKKYLKLTKKKQNILLKKYNKRNNNLMSCSKKEKMKSKNKLKEKNKERVNCIKLKKKYQTFNLKI